MNEYKGLPFKGQPFLFKNEDPSDRKPVFQYESHVKVFSTDSPEDIDQMEKIFTRIKGGKASLDDYSRQYNSDRQQWDIFMVWTDHSYTSPEEKKDKK